MSNPINSGKRLVTRIVLLQAGCALGVAALLALVGGLPAAQAAAAGGLTVTAGNAVFGWRLLAPGVAPPPQLLLAAFVGEALKLLLIVVGMWFALAKLQLPPLPLITGVFAALAGHWLGLMWFR